MKETAMAGKQGFEQGMKVLSHVEEVAGKVLFPSSSDGGAD